MDGPTKIPLDGEPSNTVGTWGARKRWLWLKN